MTLADNLKLALDAVRSIPGRLGLRPYTVTLRVRSWSGARAGLGTSTDTDTPLKVNGFDPHVRQLSQRDVIASGGLYTSEDFEIILTPNFVVGSVSGGVAASTLDPLVSASPQEIFYKLTGPGIVSAAWFKKIGQNITNPVTTMITIRKTAEII